MICLRSITIISLIIAFSFIHCNGNIIVNREPQCSHSFENKSWGISLCFEDPYNFSQNKNIEKSRIFFGPKMDWPFYDRYHPYAMRITPHITKANLIIILKSKRKIEKGNPVARTISKQMEWVSNINVFNVAGKDVITFKQGSMIVQCEQVVYTVIGKKYNYELTYPNCGGIATEIFHFDAKMYFVDLIKSMTYYE